MTPAHLPAPAPADCERDILTQLDIHTREERLITAHDIYLLVFKPILDELVIQQKVVENVLGDCHTCHHRWPELEACSRCSGICLQCALASAIHDVGLGKLQIEQLQKKTGNGHATAVLDQQRLSQ